MHELAIAQSVVDAVLEQTQGRRVLAVRLSVGRLAGVVADALEFSFDLVAQGTDLEGARLEIDQPEGLLHCRSCQADVPRADLILLCECGSADVEVRAGRELMLTSVEVA